MIFATGYDTLLSKVVSLRAKRSNPIVGRLLRHFVPRNDTLLISQKRFAGDHNYHKLASLIAAFFLCSFAPSLINNIFAQNDESGNSGNVQDSSVFRPKIEFTASGLRDPFKDYITPEEIDIREKIGVGEGKEGEVFNPPALKIEGMIWGGIKPCAIINGEVKKEGENIEGVTILKIEKKGLELLYEGKKYNLP